MSDATLNDPQRPGGRSHGCLHGCLRGLARGLAPLGALALALALASGCQANAGKSGWGDGKKGAGKEEEEKEEAIPVVPGAVEIGSITAQINAASTIEAEQQVTIHAESTGRIVSLVVEEGDKVKKGQSLARIKFDAQSSALLRANTSLAKAEEDFSRAEQLYREGIIGKEEFERSKNTVELARLDVRDRNREIKNTNILAPFAGTITQRFVAEGAFVTNGAQVLSITDFDSLVARVYVPEKELDRLRLGQSADIIGKAAKGRSGAGKVDRIAPIVDASTGTVKVTVSLPPELCGPGGFLPGMYAEVILTTEHKADVPLVPKSSVVHDEDQTYVFVIDGDRAKRIRVVTGLEDAERLELIEGPAAGEAIIIAGHNGLKDGALILKVDSQGRPIEGAGEGAEKPAEGAEKPAEAEKTDDKKAGEAAGKTGEGG